MIWNRAILLCIFTVIISLNASDTGKIEIVSSNQLNEQLKGTGYIPLNLESARKYTAGQRVAGDYVVGHAAKNQRYRTAQNVNVTLRYPTSGFGKLVTYVEVTVNQTSDIGTAVFTEGGIGQHYVGLLIQAFNTYQMDYSALVYGY